MAADSSPATVALAAAADLKAAAAELGDESAAARRQRFNEILQTAERTLAPQQHPEFYSALERWFPKMSASQPSAAPSGDAESIQHDARSLIELIRGTLPELAPAERQSFFAGLREFLPQSPQNQKHVAAEGQNGSSALLIAPETLQGMLGISPSTSIDPNRLTPLFGLLVEFLVRIDDASWSVWESFGPYSKGLKRAVMMRRLIVSLLAGNCKLTVPQVQFQIAQLLRLTVALISQMNQVGKHAGSQMGQISPKMLTQAVEREPRGWTPFSVASRCWERYIDGFKDVEEGMQDAVNREVAEFVSGVVNAQSV